MSMIKVWRPPRHWMYKTKIYNVWAWLKRRCYDKTIKNYHNYWWRWISYDPKWEKFEWFYYDMKEWYSDELSIDRIDNNWNYCKSNCRWVTHTENNKNRRNNLIYKWRCISDWCEELWLKRKTIYERIRTWKTYKEALQLN